MRPLTLGSIPAPASINSYEPPFKFTGTIDKLTFKLGASQLSEVEQKTAAHDMAMAHD